MASELAIRLFGGLVIIAVVAFAGVLIRGASALEREISAEKARKK